MRANVQDRPQGFAELAGQLFISGRFCAKLGNKRFPYEATCSTSRKYASHIFSRGYRICQTHVLSMQTRSLCWSFWRCCRSVVHCLAWCFVRLLCSGSIRQCSLCSCISSVKILQAPCSVSDKISVHPPSLVEEKCKSSLSSPPSSSSPSSTANPHCQQQPTSGSFPNILTTMPVPLVSTLQSITRRPLLP